MIDIETVLVGLMIVLGLTACIFQLMMFAHITKKGGVSLVIFGWLLDPEILTEKGKDYRKIIVLCWIFIFVLMLVIREIKGLG